MMRTLFLFLLIAACGIACRVRFHGPSHKEVRKPVIYLYPVKEEHVSVSLSLKGRLTVSLPEYNGGWNVTAKPSGEIFNPADGKTYPYLFWEGEDAFDIPLDSGFVVRGDSTGIFLHIVLPQMGLNEKETNDFIEYWEPFMRVNRYNRICFPIRTFATRASMQIRPQPDCVIRVFMAYQKTDERFSLPAPAFTKPGRKGFTVVEWGGTEIEEELP